MCPSQCMLLTLCSNDWFECVDTSRFVYASEWGGYTNSTVMMYEATEFSTETWAEIPKHL